MGIHHRHKVNKDEEYFSTNKKEGATRTGSKFGAVLWKCFIVRKRHYILTTFTILLPILLFGMVAYARSHIGAVKKTEVTTPTYNDAVYEDVLFEKYKFDLESTLLLYAPNTTFTNNLMRQVQLKMNILNHGIQGFESEEALVAHYNTITSKIIFGVVFHDVEGDAMPKKLKYDIRNYDQALDWETGVLFEEGSKEYIAGTGSEDYFQSGFLPLQMAIDMEYIYMGNESSRKVTLAMQEFPYPPYEVNKGLIDILVHVVPFITLFSYILICPTTLKNVVEERASGIKELMKLMGLPSYALWCSWFLDMLLVNIVSIVCVVVIMKFDWGNETKPLEHCDFVIFGLFLVIYCASNTVACFVISTIINSPNFTVIFGILFWHLTYILPYCFSSYMNTSLLTYKVLACIFPNVALYYGYQIISTYEERGVGVQWSNLFYPATDWYQDLSLGWLLVLSCIYMICFMLLILYVDSELNLITQLYIKIGSSRPNSVTSPDENKIMINGHNDMIEECHLEPGIQISNLNKTYENKVAVDNLTVDFYKGEITILLGHNGAGKTTTMSIISGMIQPTKGDIQIGNYTIGKSNLDKPKVGICPQKDLLLPDLTVRQHLVLFGKLNNIQDVQNQVEDMLGKLNLKDEQNLLPHQLSGGMKRKLSLGIALISNPQVLILDEPTSSLDPKSRREIWDILLHWQKSSAGNCTTLITTHYMEEAEVLGNRIALIDHGNLVAFGSPMFLKTAYKTGHKLTIIKKTIHKEAEIGKIIWGKVDELQCIANETDRINTYLLLCGMSEITKLIEELEKNKDELGIKEIMFEATSMEDVFLKMSTSAKVATSDIKIDMIESGEIKREPDSESSKSSSWPPILILLKYHMMVTKKMWRTYSVYVLLSALIIGLSILLSTPPQFRKLLKRQEFEINLYNYGDTLVYCSASKDSTNIFLDKYKTVVAQRNSEPVEVHSLSSVSNGLIKLGKDNIEHYKQHAIVAAEFNSTTDGTIVNMMYSNLALHGATISLNLATNAIAKTYLGDEFSIETYNVPLPKQTINGLSQRLTLQISLTMMMFLPIGVLFLISCFIIYPFYERNRNTMQLVCMTGISNLTYWMQILLFDMTFYIIVTILMIVVIPSFNPILYHVDVLVALWVILLIYGTFSIPLAYKFTSARSLCSAITTFQTINIFSGFILATWVLLFENSGDEKYEQAGFYLNKVFSISPQYWLTHTIYQFSKKSIWNYNWNNMDLENRKLKCYFTENACCHDDNSEMCSTFKSYSSIYLNSDLVMLFGVHTFMYIVWLIYDHSNKYKLCNKSIPEGDFKEEKFTCEHIRKKYSSKLALEDLKFSVRPKHCYGILGTNGAGKSTAMKVLTGLDRPDSGTALINQLDLKQDRSEYLKSIGYCPQVDSINDVLTVKEMLMLFANLRGLLQAEYEVYKIMKLLGLYEYRHTLSGNCSGGNKRKLNLGISLLADPKVIILDEPTAGIDPASRRIIWEVLMKMKTDKRKSLILTSHSMDECEMLCDDIAIMKSSKILEQGNVSNLKVNFGKYFTIRIKVQDCIDTVETEFIKKFVDFHPIMNNKQEALLEFYIDSSTSISTILNKIAEFKEEHENYVEDYSVSMATLEDIFLNITREETETSPKPEFSIVAVA